MAARRESPYRRESDLFADEFQRGLKYTNRRPRGSGDWLLIYTAAGAGRIVTPRGATVVLPGDCILYAPDESQNYSTDPVARHWTLLWSHFLPRPGWHPWMQWPLNAVGVRALRLDRSEIRQPFVRALRRAIAVSRGRLPNATDFAANALEEALLWGHVAASHGDWVRLDVRVRRAMDYLAANLALPFRLEALARHCGLSVSRLAHVFKAEAGVSPQRFFEQQRMHQAAQLLRGTGLGIAEVATKLGYEDPFYFSNRFRRHSGQSPSAYRRRSSRDSRQ